MTPNMFYFEALSGVLRSNDIFIIKHNVIIIIKSTVWRHVVIIF
jgi:hypothetical protein